MMADDHQTGRMSGADPPDPVHGSFETTPTAIALPLLGMLGGVCGEPVSVRLHDHPPDIIGALQRLIREHVPRDRVCEIFGQADLRRLKRSASEFALILVYPTPGHPSTSLVVQWLLERSRRTRLPMVFLAGEQCDPEAPGAILRLGTGPAEIARLRTLFAGTPATDRCVQKFFSRPWGPKLEVSFAKLPALFGPTSETLWTPRSLRTLQILRGLLAGHRLLKCLGDASEDLHLISPDLDDYAGVCELLIRSRAGLPEELGDPILSAMVRRANLHLRYREMESQGPRPVHRGREGVSSLTKAREGHRVAARNRPIGLRELADLGNLRASMTLELIEAALGSSDLGAIQGLGLVKRLPANAPPGSMHPG